MARVFASVPDSFLKSSVGPEIMCQRVKTCTAVRRPLNCPGTNRKCGVVLSHSSVMIKTDKNVYVLVEYMCENRVLVQKMPQIHIKDGKFNYRSYSFTIDSAEQEPKQSITVRDFAFQMIDYMKDRPFETFTHNCHQARFKTMRKFGMKSPQPARGNANTLFQGVIDYFRPEFEM